MFSSSLLVAGTSMTTTSMEPFRRILRCLVLYICKQIDWYDEVKGWILVTKQLVLMRFFEAFCSK